MTTIIPKCLGKWRRHKWTDKSGKPTNLCHRRAGPVECNAVRNPKAKEL